MNNIRATLACAITLMLTMSGAWGQESGDLLPTGSGVEPVVGGVLSCPAGTTEFVDQFPNVTNGPEGGVSSDTYSLQGTEGQIDVTVTITYFGESDGDKDNSFDFQITDGLVHQFLVKSGEDNILYDYPVQTALDTGLNLRVGGAKDVSHLKFCLSTSTPDTEPPAVTITSPPEGAEVSGTVTVKATVTDNVEVSSVTASVDGVSLGDGTFTDPDQYEWSWDTTTLSDGSYTVTVTATDTSDNTTTDSVNVTVVTSVSDCEGLLGDDDAEETEGCNPSGVQNVQVPPDNKLETCISNDGSECTITEFLLTPDPEKKEGVAPHLVDICTGENVFPDPRVDVNGFPQDVRPLFVFTELGGAPDSAPGLELVMDEFTYGNPCFAVVFGSRNFNLTDAFFWPVDPATGLVIIRTQFADLITGIGPVTECFDESDNPDLQEAAQATYQRDNRSQMIEGTAAAMTNRCFNPERMSTVEFSFGLLNTKEHGSIDFGSATGPDDVLDFKIERADAKFDALEQSLNLAEPDLVSPKFSELTRKLNQARSQFDKRNSKALARALEDLEDLLFEVKNGTWNVTEDNRPGDVQMRVENLIWRVTLLKRALENL